jgi:hypothetical protein
MKSQHKKFIALGAVVVLCGIALSPPVRIAIHKNRMLTYRQKITSLGIEDDRFLAVRPKYNRHRAALVSLGYLEKRSIPLTNMLLDSSVEQYNAFRTRMLEQFPEQEFSDYSFMEYKGYNSNDPQVVTVFARPDLMQVCADAIQKYDRSLKKNEEGQQSPGE